MISPNITYHILVSETHISVKRFQANRISCQLLLMTMSQIMMETSKLLTDSTTCRSTEAQITSTVHKTAHPMF